MRIPAAASFALALSFAFTPAKAAPEDLAGVWVPISSERERAPKDGSPGPVKAVGRFMGDYKAPILQPWAAEKVKHVHDLHASGGAYVAPEQRCLPYGVPHVINVPYPFQILVTPDLVVILYEVAAMARFIYMNEKLPESVKTTWMGTSVGRWEGDTLVVDTVGNDARTDVDSYGTPHTEDMKVTEYYRVDPANKHLTIEYVVDDPKTFTTKWKGVSGYSRTDTTIMEYVCAENNRDFAAAAAQQ